MLCQHCQKRIANVHFTQVVNSSKVEMYLCEQCANEKGKLSFGNPLSIKDFFSGLIGFNSVPYISPDPTEQVCSKCGMGYADFQKTGKLGCDNCYKLFGDRLQPILKRLHGNLEHGGKIPAKLTKSISNAKEIEGLKLLLNEAIKNEEYEKAAEIRDRIRSLEVEI